MDDLSIYRQYSLPDGHENLSRYRAGGLHPVSLGDIFNDGRYKIYHKLGGEDFSTLWLAYDAQYDNNYEMFCFSCYLPC
jgi:serine/threonine-protein kinase SRPK3